MGTRYRALAAPIDASTGDRRRFAEGSLTNQPLPAPLRWVRADEGAHTGAVTVGAIEAVEMDGEEAWITFSMLDDVDPARLPRLAEDVAEAQTLIDAGVVGISVDPDDFEATMVRVGTSEPITEADLDDPDAQFEDLITKARIRSGTLVAIPAFVETNHTITRLPDAEQDEVDTDAELLALVASFGPRDLVPLSAFTPPVPIVGPTPMTYDFSVTPPVAYGHVMTWDTCHAGFPDMCLLPPRDPSGGKYRDFHTHRVETDQGTIYAGRITAGGTHPPMDDFSVDAGAVRRHHDAMTTAAYVRATEDDWGLLVCGPIRPGLDEDTMRVLSRRKVSPDWRETVDGLSMIEVLALPPGPRAVSEPGYPVPMTFGYSGGRQVALTAALGPEAPSTRAPRPDLQQVFREAYGVIKDEEARARAEAEGAQLARAELASVAALDALDARAELAAITEGA